MSLDAVNHAGDSASIAKHNSESAVFRDVQNHIAGPAGTSAGRAPTECPGNDHGAKKYLPNLELHDKSATGNTPHHDQPQHQPKAHHKPHNGETTGDTANRAPNHPGTPRSDACPVEKTAPGANKGDGTRPNTPIGGDGTRPNTPIGGDVTKPSLQDFLKKTNPDNWKFKDQPGKWFDAAHTK